MEKKQVSFEYFKIASRILLVGYLAAIFWITLIGREKSYSVNMLMHPFWEYIELFKNPCWHSSHDIVLNILLFIPFGILLPIAIPNKNLKFTVVSALLLSAFIECSQLIFERGWCEIDDIFNNTVGACIGFLIYKLAYIIVRRSE